jgi:hypothetical protein
MENLSTDDDKIRQLTARPEGLERGMGNDRHPVQDLSKTSCPAPQQEVPRGHPLCQEIQYRSSRSTAPTMGKPTRAGEIGKGNLSSKKKEGR